MPAQPARRIRCSRDAACEAIIAPIIAPGISPIPEIPGAPAAIAGAGPAAVAEVAAAGAAAASAGAAEDAATDDAGAAPPAAAPGADGLPRLPLPRLRRWLPRLSLRRLIPAAPWPPQPPKPWDQLPPSHRCAAAPAHAHAPEAAQHPGQGLHELRKGARVDAAPEAAA